MSEQIVYRMRANRQKMLFGGEAIPDPTLLESAAIPEPKVKEVEDSKVVEMEKSDPLKNVESGKGWVPCACGGKKFVEESGEYVCDACGRPAIAQSDIDDEGGDLPKKDQMKESTETVGDYLNDEDKKRPKGHRIIRSEPHDMTTAAKPNIDAAIAEALGMKVKESVEVDTSRWSYSSGKKVPKGYGMWYFKIGSEEVAFSDIYAEAKKKAVALAKQKGISRISLMT